MNIIGVARTKLSRLGMALFYAYISLSVVGCAGVVFGIIVMIMKLAQISSTIDAPLWQTVALTLVSAIMIKIFKRESLSLLGLEGVQQIKTMVEEVEQVKQASNSNVIPFVRKSNW